MTGADLFPSDPKKADVYDVAVSILEAAAEGALATLAAVGTVAGNPDRCDGWYSGNCYAEEHLENLAHLAQQIEGEEGEGGDESLTFGTTPPRGQA